MFSCLGSDISISTRKPRSAGSSPTVCRRCSWWPSPEIFLLLGINFDVLGDRVNGGEDLIRGRLEGEYWVTLMCLLIISSIGSVSHSDSWLVSQSVTRLVIYLVSQSVSKQILQYHNFHKYLHVWSLGQGTPVVPVVVRPWAKKIIKTIRSWS